MTLRDTWIEDPNYSGALPAAGAYTDQAYSDLAALAVGGAYPRRMTIAIGYTRQSGVNGQMKIKVQWAIHGKTGYFEPLIDASAPTVAPPLITVPEYIIEVKGPVVSTDGEFRWRQLSIEVPCAATGVRVLAAECGSDLTKPGTAVIDLAFSEVP